MKVFERILLFVFIIAIVSAAPLMLEARDDFINSLTKSSMAVFFYGSQNTPEYSAFQNILPTDKQLFSDLEFYFIPSSSIKLSKKEKSLFMYRNIQGNQWLTYDGPFDVKMMSQWVRHNCVDSLPDVKGQQIDDMLIKRQSGFILLDMGKFQLLATKILINDYCIKHKLKCRKCTLNNDALRIVVQLMEADDQYGVSKLAFWDAKTSKFELFNKAPLHQLKQEHLIEMHQGKQGLVKADTTPKKPEQEPELDDIKQPGNEDL